MSNVISLVNARAERDGSFVNNNYGFIRNCIIDLRPGEDITYINNNGAEVIGLDGYAIIPKEEYVALRKAAHEGLTFWQKVKLLFG